MTKKLFSKQGFSLIEMMIALVILSVSILALSSVTLMAIRTNMNNEVRNTASRVSKEAANDLFAIPFDEVENGNETRTVPIRGNNKTFTTSWEVEDKAGVKQVEINVQYVIGTATFVNRSVIFRAGT